MSASMQPFVERRRGPSRVGRYALWQLADYLKDRGLPTLIVSLLGGYVTLIPMLVNYKHQLAILPQGLITRYGGIEGARVVLMHDVNEMFLANFLGVLVYLGAIFAINGIVADDRKKGYYRFLFSEPVSPRRYYGQAFLVHWLGFVIVVCLLALVYGALLLPLLTLPLVSVVALMYLMYAGMGFALSAVARWDWLSLVAATVFAQTMWSLYGASTSALARLLYLLPPVHRTREIYEALAKHTPLDTGLLIWYAGYGIVCYLIGLVVLRYRRLAIV
ncbi:MAG: hypothetical protein ABIT20_10195 [Gemmatimonadaceae bacterium]